MGDIDLSKFRALYSQTALEYLKKLEENIDLLKNDLTNKNEMNEIFIAAHSLKSQSLIMGYASLADASLALEKTFRALKEGSQTLTMEMIGAVSTLLLSVRESLSQVVEGRGEIDLTEKVATFRQKIGEIE